MGCTSSSLSFRDVYIDHQQRWGLDPRFYEKFVPKGFHDRSSVFVSCASDTARQASQQLLSREGAHLTCDSLLVEQASLLTHPLFKIEGSDKLHPYDAILFRRLLAAVPQEHARYAATEVLSIIEDGGFITRWDYRVWMVACCEFYHVLAVLQEQQALPKASEAFVKAFTGSAKRKRLHQESRENTVVYQDVLEALWRKGSAVQCTTSTLGASVMRQLRSEMPSVLGRVRNDAPSNITTTSANSEAPQIIAFAKEYEKRVMLKEDCHGNNPLQNSGAVSLLVFAEWAAIECALFFCGQEDDSLSYGVVPVPPSATLPQNGESLQQQWRAQLLRLSELERELAELEPLGQFSKAYQELLAKKENQEEQMEKQIAKWRGGREVLTAEDVEDMCWNMLQVWESLPNRTVHQVLSRRAFECVVGSGSTISTTNEFCQYSRYYLALHDLYCDVVSQQLKRSELEGLGNGSGLPRHIAFDIFQTALAAAQARQDVCLDATQVAAAGCVLLTPAFVLDVLRQLFDSVAENGSGDGLKTAEDGVEAAEDEVEDAEDEVEDAEDAEDGVEAGEDGVQAAEEVEDAEDAEDAEDGVEAAEDGVEAAEDGVEVAIFEARSTMVVRDLTRVHHVFPPRRSIDELRSAVGVDKQKQQRVFVVSFLRNVFALNQEDFSACNPQVAAKALETAVELPFYTNHSAFIAAMVIRYVTLNPHCWLAFSPGDEADSVALTNWLYRLRFESLDRLELMGDPANMEFFVRALFCVAAAQRSFEDTVPGAEKPESFDLSCDIEQFNAMRPLMTTSVTEPHFVRAVEVITKFLECPAEVLLNNIQAVFLRGGNEEEMLVTQAADPEFSVERAFRCFQRVAHLGGHLHWCDDEVEEGDVHGEAETANVQHILFLMVYNYTRQHCSAYWRAHRRYDNDPDAFLSGAADGSADDYLTWEGEGALLDLSRAMPLRSLADCYRVFAQLTEHEAQAVWHAEDASGAQAAFLCAFYAQYLPFFERLGLNVSQVAGVGAQALQFIENQSRRGCRDKGVLGITRGDFSSFLQFVLGYLMTETAYNSVMQSNAQASGVVLNALSEVILSEEDLRCILACFGRFEKGGLSAIPTLEDARLWLTAQRVDDTRKGFISLENALLWYSSYRAEHYALKSLYDLWGESYALRIPFTLSAEHSLERQSAMREILRAKHCCLDFPESYPIEAHKHGDDYLPVEIAFAVFERLWGIGEVSKRVFMNQEQPEELAPPADGEAAQKTSSSAPLWLVICEHKVKVLLDRTDNAWRGVHCSDFRFFLQYVHHFISAYISLYYALAVRAACSDAMSADSSVCRFLSTPAEQEAALTEIFSLSLLSLLPSSVSVSGEMPSTLSRVVADTLHDMQTTGVVLDETCQRGAHFIAAALVSHSHIVSFSPRPSCVAKIETKDLPETITTPTIFLGELISCNSSEKLSYWERLRTVLPFGLSLLHRQRRRELFMWMDYHRRGYLTMSDIARGLTNMVRLQTFRSDFTPALLRAFKGTKSLTGEPKNRVYLTEHTEEQVLLPWELKAFLAYLYRYLELYFMFDVLTCTGYVNPETLHVEQNMQRYGADGLDEALSSGGFGGVGTSQEAGGAVAASVTTDSATAAPHTRSAADALYEASARPYQITLEAAPMKKEVSLAQFQLACDVLRRWGAHVEKPVKVFQRISRQCRQEGKLLFNEFVIWASEYGIRPEGYDYGSDTSLDPVADVKEGVRLSLTHSGVAMPEVF
ncbi:hypothetical protein JKF63_05297 [Porcisia hertigi]|uniref:Flagellar calcium-binding protein EF-hand domain-containing protein n=1 Tax=Porcisia hertigi TaxID=2761500 RepID=A0A836IYX3_9TRYP|nr:hypothetical protein JKF63_05297 [Porcisia hertigi]